MRAFGFLPAGLGDGFEVFLAFLGAAAHTINVNPPENHLTASLEIEQTCIASYGEVLRAEEAGEQCMTQVAASLRHHKIADEVIRANGLVRLTDSPKKHYIVQKADLFDAVQLFPQGKISPQKQPLAIFIGPRIPEGEVRTSADHLLRV